MPESCTVNETEIVALALRRAKEHFTGAWILDTEGPRQAWRFENGRLTDVWIESGPSILETALVDEAPVRDKDRKRVKKQAQTDGRDAGEIALEQGLVSPNDVGAFVLGEIERRLATLCSGSAVTIEEHFDDWPIEGQGIASVLDLTISLEEILVGAAQRISRWELVEAHLPSLKDVYYATPQTFELMQRADEFPLEISLVNLLDGEKDLMEVLRQCPADPFTAYGALFRLHELGSVGMINPVQLYQQGCDLEKRREHDRALRRFERADERGLDDFDLGYKLAECYEKLERSEDAIRHYLAFAEKCINQYRFEDTLRAFRKIIEIDPDNYAARDQYLSLLSKYGNEEDALANGLELARLYASEGRDDQVKETLEKFLDQAANNESVIQEYLEVCRRIGDPAGQKRAQRMLGDLFHDREESGKALELYQNLFVRGEDTVEVRMRLGELHYRAGRFEEASAHLTALRSDPNWSPRRASSDALQYYRSLLDVGDPESFVTTWLVDEARTRRDRESLQEILPHHREALVREERYTEARKAAEQLHQLNPIDTDAAHVLAELEIAHGSRSRAARVLESVAFELARRDAESSKVVDVLEKLLDADPASGFARRTLLEKLPETDTVRRDRLLRELTLLDALAGDSKAGLEGIEHLADDPLAAYQIAVMGQLFLGHGNSSAALECFHRVARFATDQRDLGLIETAATAIEAITPDDPEVEQLRSMLKAATAPPPTPVAPAPVEAPPEPVERRASEEPDSIGSAATARATTKDAASVENLGPRAPAPVRTRISNITAKLKNVKGGDDDAPSDRPTPSASGTGTSVEKLRSLMKSQGEPDDQPEGSEEVAKMAEAVRHPSPKSTSLGGSLAKMRALRGGDAPATANNLDDADPSPADVHEETSASNPPVPASPTAPASSSDESPEAAVEHPTPKKAIIGGAASKLSSLRGAGD